MGPSTTAKSSRGAAPVVLLWRRATVAAQGAGCMSSEHDECISVNLFSWQCWLQPFVAPGLCQVCLVAILHLAGGRATARAGL